MLFGSPQKALPKLLPSNPGKGIAGNVAFSNAEKTWTEHYHLATLAASALQEQGHPVQCEESWLVLKESGFLVLPQLVHLQRLHNSGVRTTTTIQVNHPALVPDGIFEYQHSTGDNVEDSFRKGFVQWAQTDLVALLDALRPETSVCTTLKFDFPEKDGGPAYSRRAVLGPVAHYVQNPQTYANEIVPQAGENREVEQCERHEFCPCCLLTNSFKTFNEFIENNGFYGLRLFAARDQNGTAQADCRVNGTDWEKGAEALRKYVETWPQAGFEFRKQYVILQSV